MTAQRPALPLSAFAAWREAGLFGLPAGALLALPVALRSGNSLAGGSLVWVAGCGLLGVATTLTAGMVRSARPLPGSIAFVPLGLLIALGPLAFLGKLLHANTHHRPLGAATFSMLAFVVVLGAMAVAARTRRLLSSSNPGKQTFGRALLIVGVTASLALGLRAFIALLASASSHPSYIGAILDGLLGLALSLVGGFSRFPVRIERLARLAGPLAVAICVLLMLVAFKTPGVSAALAHSSALWYALHPT